MRVKAAVAIGVWAAVIVVSVAMIVFAFVTGSSEATLDQLMLVLAFVLFASVGALVALRRPGNSVGWILLAIGAIAIGAGAFGVYSEYAAEHELRGAATAGWLGNVGWYPVPTLILTLLPLRFPTGRPPGPRWQWLDVVARAGLAALLLVAAFGEVDGAKSPIAIPVIERFAPQLQVAILLALLPIGVLCAASLVVRYRRAGPDERAQLKWMVFAASLAILGVFLEVLFPQSNDYSVGIEYLLFPVAIGIAILRYRLYDIDRIINRTLVYGAITVVLGSVYVLGVLTVPAVLPVSDDSPFVVAASTLAVVALFGPLRRRVQSFVDRRFYRARYDAARTVESFTARLRTTTDLESLDRELVGVVSQTVQPASVSLWLRPAGDGR